ncbi:MAG: hypothetical protein IPJ88_18045 [Myxococcales bacterium]|nr:MAG: hypothetical protein IPJ88_18045 [Myxococcales bacterium]
MKNRLYNFATPLIVITLSFSLVACSAQTSTNSLDKSGDNSTMAIAATAGTSLFLDAATITAYAFSAATLGVIAVGAVGLLWLAGDAAQYHAERLAALQQTSGEYFTTWLNSGAAPDGNWVSASWAAVEADGMGVSQDEFFYDMAQGVIPVLLASVVDRSSEVYASGDVDAESLRIFWVGAAQSLGIAPNSVSVPTKVSELASWLDDLIFAEAQRRSYELHPYDSPRIVDFATQKVAVFNELFSFATISMQFAKVVAAASSTGDAMGEFQKRAAEILEEYTTKVIQCGEDETCKIQAYVVYWQQMLQLARDGLAKIEAVMANSGEAVADALAVALAWMQAWVDFAECMLAATERHLERIKDDGNFVESGKTFLQDTYVCAEYMRGIK